MSGDASFRRRRRRGVRWRPRIRSQRARVQRARRRAPDRAAGARVRPGARRRRPRAEDPERAGGLPAQERTSPATGGSIAGRDSLWERAAARCSDSGSSAWAPWAGTSRCSSSGCAGYGLGARAVDGHFTRSDRGRVEPLPAAARPRPRRDRRPEHVPRARGERADRLARRRGRGKLLLDRGALPREPVAARAGERDLADARDRPRPATRAPGGRPTTAPTSAGPPASGTRSAPRSTTGRGSTASTRSSRERSRGWSPGSRRTSSRASARSA